MVNTGLLLERYLHRALRLTSTADAPPRLCAAMRHAVFPGGARVRPQLCLGVALASGAELTPAALITATAIELLHCASLTHDDMPCFDNANVRRGRPSVHRAFGERLALLAGDALIVLAFQTVAQDCRVTAEERVRILLMLSSAVGVPNGLCAGQAWECEPQLAISHYQRCKTGALFVAATMAGASAAGADAESWRRVGEYIGEAYQVADDIFDVTGSAEVLGKPTGRDALLGRPNCVAELGMAGAHARLRGLIDAAIAVIPRLYRLRELANRMREASQYLLSARLARPAA